MKYWLILFAGFLLAAFLFAACGSQAPAVILPSPHTPARIVSLDYCADQYVLKLADAGAVLALSPDAQKPFSYLRAQAASHPSVRPNAEDVLTLKPDLIVRSYGGGPQAEAFYARAGIPVLNIGWAGDIEAIKRVTHEVASGLGQRARGAKLTAEIDARIAAITPRSDSLQALYVTAFGATTGPGSLPHELMLMAGLTNYEQRSGWHDLPLESLAKAQPDRVAAAFFDTHDSRLSGWNAMRHPVAKAQLEDRPVIALDGSWMTCGAWFALDAVEAMAAQTALGGAL